MKRSNLVRVIGCLTFLSFFATSAYSQAFSLPNRFNYKSLFEAVNSYAEEVETCLHVAAEDRTEGANEWLYDRRNNTRAIYSSLKSRPEVYTVQELLNNRSEVCDTVFDKLVDKKYCGTQYGNCGEGAMVNYCLAHETGMKNVIRCSSENDHAFSLFLKQGNTSSEDTICLMDRWPLGPNASEGQGRNETQYFFCGVSVVNGKIHYKGRLLQGREWYDKVSCKDWMSEFGDRANLRFANLTPKIWNDDYLVEDDFINRRLIATLAEVKEKHIKKISYVKRRNGKVSITIKLGNLFGSSRVNKFERVLKQRLGSNYSKYNVKTQTNPFKSKTITLDVASVEDFVNIFR